MCRALIGNGPAHRQNPNRSKTPAAPHLTTDPARDILQRGNVRRLRFMLHEVPTRRPCRLVGARRIAVFTPGPNSPSIAGALECATVAHRHGAASDCEPLTVGRLPAPCYLHYEALSDHARTALQSVSAAPCRLCGRFAETTAIGGLEAPRICKAIAARPRRSNCCRHRHP